MERAASWKVVTAGVALTGLGIIGAGVAGAATEASGWAPESVVVGALPAGTLVAHDDDWTETYWDDQSSAQGYSDDWTETYWDD